MLLVGMWLFAWHLLHEQTGCLMLSLLIFPVTALIGFNMLEVTFMRRRAFANMYLAHSSWLAGLLTRKFFPTVWAVIKALVFTFILFLEASDWALWIWIILFIDIILLAITHGWLSKLLQLQVKPGQTGIISRRILVSINTMLLSVTIASGQFLTTQPDYREYSWQETITYAASMSQSGCELIAPLHRLKSIKDAVGWRLAANGLSGLQNILAALLGWLVFLLSSSLSLWAFSRMITGVSIGRSELQQIFHHQP